MEEERFALDNNDNVLDFEDKTDKYCLSQEDVCNLLNRQQKRIAELEQELAELKEKDNYHLRYELAGADETITNLKEQLAEKQNTIDEINKEFEQAVHDWKALCAEKDKEIEMLKHTLNLYNLRHKGSVLPNVNQLAIWELEKIINIFEPYKNDNRDTILELNNNVSFIDYIEQRIKELGGK